jgi:hypothetical protein
MNLAKFISNIQQETSKIPHLNYGGCGQFVYELGSVLADLNIPFTICYNDYWEKPILKPSKFCASHVMIHIPKIGIVDGKETLSKKELQQEYKDNTTYSKCLKTLKQLIHEIEWNSRYSHRYDPKLREIIMRHAVLLR